MSKEIGTKQKKSSVHKMNDGNPAIKMMDKIYKAQKANKNKDLDEYNKMCGPVTIIKKAGTEQC
jgi:hypothetical protein